MTTQPKPSEYLPLSPARRRRIERTIEALLALLDAADGEPDLEATGDEEPYLAGWSGTNEDLEDENEHGSDNGPYDAGWCLWSDDPDVPQQGSAWHGGLDRNVT